MKNIAPTRARRAGWAAVIVDGAAKIANGIVVTCGDSYPTSLCAELHGVVNMLRWAIAPLTIWVDNQNVVDGFVKCEVWRCSASRPVADLWREAWHLYDGIGGGIAVNKCKGHATVADVEKGVATDFLRTGNSHADHFAGRGAQLEEQQCPSEAALKEYNDALQRCWWLAALTEHWPADTQFRR